MPNIRISDTVSLPIDVSPNGSLAQYLRNPLSLLAAFSLDTPLVKSPLRALRSGLTLETSVDLLGTSAQNSGGGANKAELKLKAGTTVGLRLFKAGSILFDDHFQGPALLQDPANTGPSPLNVPEGKAVLAFDLRPEVQVGVEGAAGPLSFGVSKKDTLTFANYRSFDVTATTPTVGAAVSTTVKEFVIPSTLADLRKIPKGATVTVDSAADLTFQGGLSYSGAPKPFASLGVPGLNDPIEVTPGYSVGISGSFRLFNEYQLRVWKDDETGKIRLGYYKVKGREGKVTVTAEAALKIGAGDRSATVQLVRLASGNKLVDEEQLTEAGLPAARIEAIAEVVKNGMNRKIEASIEASFRRLKQGSAAFLFEIDLVALDKTGREAVRRALRKDITGLGDGDLVKSPKGVKVIRTIFRDVTEEETSVRINLFGIFNYISVSRLLLDSQVVHTPGGEFAIVDQITSTQTKATLDNLKKSDRALRRLIDEAMVVTAVYRGARHAVGGPELDSSHTYFELHQRTNRRQMKDNLDVVKALSLITSKRQSALLGGHKDFGPSTFYLESAFNDREFRSMFVGKSGRNGGRARTETEFDAVGIRALGALYAGEEPNETRWRVMKKEWSQLKKAPVKNTARAVGRRHRLSTDQRAALLSDVLKIRTWSSAMVDLAEVLLEVAPYFRNEERDPDSEDFKKLQTRLRKNVGKVAREARAQWGDPWGLVALHCLAGQKGFRRVKFTGDKVMLDITRERTAAAAA